MPFDKWDVWKDVRALPLEEQKQALRDPETRQKLIEVASRPYDGPMIVAGDFNTWSPERLALVEATMRRLELEEVTGFAPGRRTGDMGSSFLNRLAGVTNHIPLDRACHQVQGRRINPVYVLYQNDDRAARRRRPWIPRAGAPNWR